MTLILLKLLWREKPSHKLLPRPSAALTILKLSPRFLLPRTIFRFREVSFAHGILSRHLRKVIPFHKPSAATVWHTFLRLISSSASPPNYPKASGKQRCPNETPLSWLVEVFLPVNQECYDWHESKLLTASCRGWCRGFRADWWIVSIPSS